MSLSCTVSKILSLISQSLNKLRDSEHIPFGSNISCTHSYSYVSISTRNWKCLASTITNNNNNNNPICKAPECQKTSVALKFAPLGGYEPPTFRLTAEKMWQGQHIKNGSRWRGFDTVYLQQSFTILTSDIPETSLGASKFKEGHVTLTTPF